MMIRASRFAYRFYPLNAIRDDLIYCPSYFALPPPAGSLLLAALIWSPDPAGGGGAGGMLVSRWRAVCFLLPVSHCLVCVVSLPAFYVTLFFRI